MGAYEYKYDEDHPFLPPEVTTQAPSPIYTESTTANGTIVSGSGDEVVNRGFIHYLYTGTNKIIGGTGVTNIDENGAPDFPTGTYNLSLTGLSPNVRYSVRAHATNSSATGYGPRVDFRALVNVPSPPSVINPTSSSLDVVVNTNGNPDSTEYAIQDSAATSKYVQADGTRNAAAVWQTAANWDTITVTGLATGTTYYFRVKARNGDNAETNFSRTTARNTCANPTDGGTIGASQSICTGSTPNALTNLAHASNYGGILQYQWQKATAADSTLFSTIANADTAGYVPWTLTINTWYRRLSRVSCKADWTGATPSNVV
jgi:hypothetical protein